MAALSIAPNGPDAVDVIGASTRPVPHAHFSLFTSDLLRMDRAMPYVISFLPWVAYAALPSKDWQWAALAGCAIAVALLLKRRAAGRTLDSLIIEFGSAVYFAALAAVAFHDPDSHWHDYSAAFSSLFLAVIAGFSLLIGKPFTLGIAKQSTPRETWNTPLFVRANVVITAVWTLAFAAAGTALATMAHAGHAHTTAATAVQAAGFVLPVLFTVRYVAGVQTAAAAR